MFNARQAGGRLYGKQLFTWLSLVVSLMASFCAVLFPLDVLDEIWDLNPPSNFYCWPSQCGSSVMVIHVIYKYKNR